MTVSTFLISSTSFIKSCKSFCNAFGLSFLSEVSTSMTIGPLKPSPKSSEIISYAFFSVESFGFIPLSGIPKRICVTGSAAAIKMTNPMIKAIHGLPTTNFDHGVSKLSFECILRFFG